MKHVEPVEHSQTQQLKYCKRKWSNQKYNLGRRIINITIAFNNMVDSLIFIQLQVTIGWLKFTIPILLYLCQQ